LAVPLTSSAPLWAARYIAFGDSVTEGYGDDTTRTELGYPPRLRELLRAGFDPAAEIVNAGKSGETTILALERLDSVLAGGGDVLLLMEGTNDVTAEIPPETIRFNLAEMARRAQNRGFEVVLATTIPRWPSAKQDPDNRLTYQLAQQVRDLAGGTSRDLVDPFEVFGAVPTIFGTDYFDEPGDPVGHPNAAGYTRMANSFRDVLAGTDRVPPVVGALSPADGTNGVGRNEEVFFDLWDFGQGLDLSSIRLVVNGQPVTAQVSGGTRVAEVAWDPVDPMSGFVEVVLSASDRATPPNTLVSRRVTSFLVSGSRYLEGDIDTDGRVDGSDLVRLGLAFGSQFGDSRYASRADINSDDIIDGVDLARLAANFGRTGP
jgi:lysophospholipase L1-like esterase